MPTILQFTSRRGENATSSTGSGTVRAPIQILLVLCLLCRAACAQTAEEARIPDALAALPGVADAFDPLVQDFAEQWRAAEDAKATLALTRDYGHKLWLAAKARVASGDKDDRPLYWSRLALAQIIHDIRPRFPIFPADRDAALQALERASRGMDDVRYPNERRVVRVLLTGFDPFLLDRNIGQSNPSGASVLALDGADIPFTDQHGRQQIAHIAAVVLPVRYADFDAGLVEDFLQPWLAGAQAGPHDWFEAERQRRSGQLANVAHATPQVDMVLTTSMGHAGFELERYAGLRRSTAAPDNANAFSGGTLDHPTLPRLRGRPMQGAEFLEISLPTNAMHKVQAPFVLTDNRWVRVAPDIEFAAGGIGTLHGKTAVEGSGGGYLSNEVSYRALHLRDELGVVTLPIGHLHLPPVVGYDPVKLDAILAELRAVLAASAGALAP
ncbi:MAG: hypothetical protein JO218_19705 [Burkholderiales bacterium]|nr:hypothetical protein [Burkholderiales bacterium]